MKRLNASRARKDFAATIRRIAAKKNRVVIQRAGKDVVAMIPVEDLALLEELEDYLDVQAARRALADPKNRERIPWEKVKAGLGL